MVWAIFFYSALVGHPQMNACEPTHFPPYQSLEECRSQAAKIPIGADKPPRSVYICIENTSPSK